MNDPEDAVSSAPSFISIPPLGDDGPSPAAESPEPDALAGEETQDSGGRDASEGRALSVEETSPPSAELAAHRVSEEDDSFDAYRALVRLLIGAGVEGVELLLQLLEQADAASRETPVSAQAPERPQNPLRHAIIGALIDASEIPRQGLRLGWRLANGVTELGLAASSPVANSRLAAPLRRRLEKAVQRGQEQVEHWIQLGEREERRSRDLTRAFSQDAIEEIVQALAQDPSIRMLVQVQGDTYIEYLQQENPEAVSTLVQGQSMGVAEQILDEVRERTVTGDSLIETIARALLRRPPREQLPPSPPEIKAFADAIRVRRQKQQSLQQPHPDEDSA